MRLLVLVNCLLLSLGSLNFPVLGANIASQTICTDTTGCKVQDRREYTIRASAHDADDVSAEFEQSLQAANNGGILRLNKGKKYVIGKKLDLRNLNDVHLKLEGELKVKSTGYRRAHYSSDFLVTVHR
jgi:hypothetical protein